MVISFRNGSERLFLTNRKILQESFLIHRKILDDSISVDFWASTSATITFSVFTDVVAIFEEKFEVTFVVKDIIVGLQANLPTFPSLCFGPGSDDSSGTCTCTNDFMVLDSDLFECVCKNGIEEDGVLFELSWSKEADSCQCSDRFLKREADGSCVPKSLVEVQVKRS